jgi:hydroxymethylbilane synthase
MVASSDGRQIIRQQVSGTVDDPTALGIGLADKLLEMGAGELLAQSESTE